MKEISIEEALKHTGFEICLFGPEINDNCEKCKKDNIQLYFQGPTDAGRYYCSECVIEEYVANLQYDEYIDSIKPRSENECRN